jgi:hypothetical protein
MVMKRKPASPKLKVNDKSGKPSTLCCLDL